MKDRLIAIGHIKETSEVMQTILLWIPIVGRQTICCLFQQNQSIKLFLPCTIWTLTIDLLTSDIQALFNFWPLITLKGHFEAPNSQMPYDANVASVCS